MRFLQQHGLECVLGLVKLPTVPLEIRHGILDFLSLLANEVLPYRVKAAAATAAVVPSGNADSSNQVGSDLPAPSAPEAWGDRASASRFEQALRDSLRAYGHSISGITTIVKLLVSVRSFDGLDTTGARKADVLRSAKRQQQQRLRAYAELLQAFAVPPSS